VSKSEGSSRKHRRTEHRRTGASLALAIESCKHAAMPRERIAVGVAYFVMFFGAGVWAPYFPLYLSHLGFSGTEIGIVVGTAPLLRWTSAIAWGYLADRWRRRHALLVMASFIGTVFFLPLLVVRSFTGIVIVLTCINLFHGSIIPMVDATVMDHLQRLGGNYGRLRLWGSLGFIAGALVSAPMIQAFTPLAVPALLLAPGPFLVVALYHFPRQQIGHPGLFRAPWKLLNPSLSAFLATSFLLQLSCGAWGAFFALHTARLGFSDAIPGITWAVAVIIEVGLLFWGRQIVERFDAAGLIVFTLLVTVARWSLTAIATHEVAVVALQLAHSITFAVFHLAALLLLARLVPPQNSTSGQSLYGMVGFGFGGSAGVALAGVLVDRIGTSALFGVEAFIAALALLPAWQLRRRLHRY